MTILLMTLEHTRDDPSHHVSSLELAAFLDDRLKGEERARVAGHFADCPACRDELVAMRAALGRRTETRSARWWPLAAAAAAVLLFVAVPGVLRDSSSGPETPPPVTRPGPALPDEASARFAIVVPAEGATLSSSRATLAWRSAGPSATYLLVIQDSTGSVVWTEELADTSARVPANANLRAGARYYWSVDARLADGSTMKTGVHSFVVP